MESKNFKKMTKILRKIGIFILIFGILTLIATLGIGNYFVDYAITRAGNGGNREVKNEDVILQTTDVESDIIRKNSNAENESAKEWVKTVENRKIEITANDGIILRGTSYELNEKNNKWAIILHGYRSEPNSVLSIGEHFSEKGYQVLIPSMRACGESEGEYIGMGWLDKDDLQCWINFILSENPDAEIVLHGSSMGASTVLMASGDNLPENVKAIIADSGYTSVWDIFSSEAKARFNLPSFPILNMFQLVADFRAGYDIKEASALAQVQKSQIPILFIHGDKDDFVPEYMCEKLYQAANCEKEKLIIQGAGHTEGKYKEPEQYYDTIFKFLNNRFE